jgi:hypothetical protein
VHLELSKRDWLDGALRAAELAWESSHRVMPEHHALAYSSSGTSATRASCNQSTISALLIQRKNA